MYKILRADKDAYITDKVVRSTRVTGSNVGAAGTLDLFKLYGVTRSGSYPNTELSRLLVHFDLSPLREAMEAGRLDPGDPSFWCKLRMRDVYGGQPTPTNFTVSVFPLSASFDEGLGKDVSYYSDRDVCNWLSASLNSAWYVTGCGLAGGTAGPGDYMTSSLSLASTESTQTFEVGDEDLYVDVTSVVSATLSGEIPESGFRISFENSLEDNGQTYFVKRFASRTAFDETRRPSLVAGFDDSITDDSLNLTFDTPCNVTLYNAAAGNLTNLLSGSSLVPVTGQNCLVLRLVTEVSGGNYSLVFSGSQFSYGTTGNAYVSGTYQASVTLPSSDAVIKSKLTVSSSVKFVPVWTSVDGTVAYVTGSALTASPPSRKGSRSLNNFVVSVLGLQDSYPSGSEAFVRVHIFDHTNPFVTVTRLPVELPGVVLKNVHYQVRDAATGDPVIPFDDVRNSTKVSSDASGMFFVLDTSCLSIGRTYVVDVMISHDGAKTKFMSVSPAFRVDRNGT